MWIKQLIKEGIVLHLPQRNLTFEALERFQKVL